MGVAKLWKVEQRIVCQMCSGGKHTFKHNPDGLRLFTLHMDLVHRMTLDQYDKEDIANV